MRAFTKYLRKSSGEVGILEALEGASDLWRKSSEKVIYERILSRSTDIRLTSRNINNTS